MTTLHRVRFIRFKLEINRRNGRHFPVSFSNFSEHSNVKSSQIDKLISLSSKGRQSKRQSKFKSWGRDVTCQLEIEFLGRNRRSIATYFPSYHDDSMAILSSFWWIYYTCYSAFETNAKLLSWDGTWRMNQTSISNHQWWFYIWLRPVLFYYASVIIIRWR